MKILVVGGGGREAAIAAKFYESKKVEKIFIAPGNGGTLKYGENLDIAATDIKALLSFAKENSIDLTFVGPEIPLTMGMVDEFEKEGLKAIGPNKAGAEIEGSKDFSKKIMKKYNIPTADYETFTDYEKAIAYVDEKGAPIVIKADGLAAGKGVTVAMTIDEAKVALEDIMKDKVFGDSGSRVVIEEFMDGEEASILAFTDGKTIIPMTSAQDHKRAYEGDKGPNTGGMGTYSPAPVVTDEINKQCYEKVLKPMIDGLNAEGIKYKGILYAGLMIKNGVVRVVEFNARFGDPETQVVLPRLKTDLTDICLAIADETLDKIEIEWDNTARVCVVLASGGYPAAYAKGIEITGIEEAEKTGLLVFHAGTKRSEDKLLTNGGRVLNVVAEGKDIKEAVENVYKNIDLIKFDKSFYRKDIAHRAINR